MSTHRAPDIAAFHSYNATAAFKSPLHITRYGVKRSEDTAFSIVSSGFVTPSFLLCLIVKTPVTSVRFDGYDAGVIDFSISLQYAGPLTDADEVC
jgi:hypothetical protein